VSSRRAGRGTLTTDAFRLRYGQVSRLAGTAAAATVAVTANCRQSAPQSRRSMSAEVPATNVTETQLL